MNLTHMKVARALGWNVEATFLNYLANLVRFYFWGLDAFRVFSRWTPRLGLNCCFIIGSLVFISCQKSENQMTVIQGELAELGSFETIKVKGLRLALYKSSSQSIFPTPDLKVAEFTTDENGQFYFVTRLDAYFGMYYIKLLDAPTGFYALDNSRRLTSSVFNLFQLNMNREAWLKLILNNQGGGEFDYFVFSINGIPYTHTGGGRPSVIQKVPSLDTCKIPFLDYRTNPETISFFKIIVVPNDTTEFEIDLRRP